MFRIASKPLAFAVLIAAFTLLPGCGYTLRGKVVRGETSSIEMVHEIDPRLKAPGIMNAEVMVRRDPKSPHPEMVGRTRTGDEGNFAMNIGQFGAGWMEEQWLVQAGMTGFTNAQQMSKLPPSGGKWQLLITLGPGQAAPLDQPDQITQEIDRYK
jgi:hypothetical protein